jgi:hypothetical protein
VFETLSYQWMRFELLVYEVLRYLIEDTIEKMCALHGFKLLVYAASSY